MPHRATYFFPRQFPERRLDESKLDHEKKKLVNSSIKSNDITTTFGVESDTPKSAFVNRTTSISVTKDDVVFTPSKSSAVSDLLNGGDKFRSEQKQIAAFCDWLVDKRHNHHHRRRHHRSDHHILHEEGDRELLLPHPDSAKASSPEKDVVDDVDRSFDREISLPRLSSESSYAASLFASDITATFSSDITNKDTTTSSSFRVSSKEVEQEKEGEVKEEEKCDEDSYAKKYKESYELQLALAKRLSFFSSLASEPVITFDTGLETWDAESVSRRLWVQYINNFDIDMCVSHSNTYFHEWM